MTYTTLPEDMTKAQESNKAGRRILFYFVAFFALIVAVNTYFIISAIGTHTGTVVDNPYEQGLHYNKLLEEARKNAATTKH